MKKQTVLSIIVVLVAIVPLFNASSEVSELNYAAKFSWGKLFHDFGQVQKKVPVQATFEFTNQGNAPLVIISTKGSCGCTVADYTKGEIMPGEKGMVTATYNAAKVGAFSKTVTVNANVEGKPIVLRIQGEVID